jgi:hypothetical protein
MQMNFLALAQRAFRESGLTGTGPVSVLNQLGRVGDMVNWVLEAHEEIQTARPDWSFDWAQGAFALTPGQDTYSATTDFQITGGVREFVRNGAASYLTSQGINGRMFLEYIEWERFRYLVIPAATGLPAAFTARPDGSLQYFPRPNVAATVTHEYFRLPQLLAADTDIPRMPDWSHMAIVWKAVMIGCGKTKDWSRHDTAEERFEAIFQRMLRESTPQMVTAGPLA